ncbi:MAG: glycogen synthase [bacterium]
MKNKFKVFFVASEVAPFIGKSRLAAAAGALPKSLKDFGHDIRMMMPNYRNVNERKYILRDVIRLKDMPIQIGKQAYTASGKSAFLPDSKVQIYFLDYKPFFDRQSLYFDPKTRKPYADNAERFLFFAYGCLETLKLLHWQPDVIHCNDWQTALIPLLLKTHYRDDPFFKNVHALLTIHNFEEQGAFPNSILETHEIAANGVYPGGQIEMNGKFNFLKAGMLNSDLFNVVGETYAKAVQEDRAFSKELGQILQGRRKALIGVNEGIDAARWNPVSDVHLEHHYSANNLGGKLQGKRTFAASVGLQTPESAPLLLLQLSPALAAAIPEPEKLLAQLLARKVYLIVSGEMDGKWQKTLAKFVKPHARQLLVKSDADEPFTHRALAAADMVWLAFDSECESYNHLHAMCYGTLPIVLCLAGSPEGVVDYASKSSAATGFLYDKATTAEALKVMTAAVKAFEDSKTWVKLMKNAMKKDYSWNAVAEKYTTLYSQLALSGKR